MMQIGKPVRTVVIEPLNPPCLSRNVSLIASQLPSPDQSTGEGVNGALAERLVKWVWP